MGLLGLVLAAMPLSHLVWPVEPVVPPAVAESPTQAIVGRYELKGMVADVQPTVTIRPWRKALLMTTIRLSVRNPGKDWLKRVRVDVLAYDKAVFGRPLSSSFVFDYLAPGQTATRESDRMLMRVPIAAMGKVHYDANAKVVGGQRVVLKKR